MGYTISMKRERWIWLLLVFVMICDLFSCRSLQPKPNEYAEYAQYCRLYTIHSLENSRAYQMNTKTGEEKWTHSIPGRDKTTWVSLSPYRHVLVSATETDQEKRIWWALPDTDWQVIEKTPADSYLQSPHWMPDTNGFLYLKALEETQQGDFIYYASYELMQFLFSEKTPYRIGSFQSPVSSIAWSPDKTKVAFFAQSEKKVSIWVYNITTQALTSLCAAEADQFSKNRIHWIDDQSLIWLEIQTLYSWDLEQKKKETVATLPGVILGYDFYLPDSSVCLTYTLSEPTEKTYCILYTWKNKKSQILASGYQVDSPRFSPDGSKISFFYRPLESEKPELMVYSLLTQKKTTVCRVGKITIYPWDANPTHAVWSPDSQLILVENKQEDDSIVQLYKLSPLKLLKDIVQTEYIYSYNFSPSSEWVKVEYPQEEETKITLYHWKSAEVIDLSGEWLGWTTEDFS